MPVHHKYSYTAQPNTLETDAQEKVKHIVKGTLEGKTVMVTLLAKEPLDAIKISDKLPDSAWQEAL